MSRKVAVITGAATGIGRAIANKYAEAGYDLALLDLNAGPLEQTCNELEKHGVNIQTHCVDVSDEEAMLRVADLVFAKFGQVDLLFNNAGLMAPGRILDQAAGSFRKLMDVNFFGVLNGIQAFTPRMLKQNNPSRIVNTASIAGLVATPIFAAYNASKHAVIALSETLAYELDGTNVSVSVLAPGAVATDIMKPSESLEINDEILALMAKMDSRTQEKGMPTDALADFIFSQIAADQYWILPHRDQLHRVTSRAEDILSNTNPRFKPW